MQILAIDPGPIQSAWVEYVDGKVRAFGLYDNLLLSGRIHCSSPSYHLAIEMIACYGMPVGKTVFDTCVWIGRFIERFGGGGYSLMYRREVKLHLCNSVRAKDSNIRQALIDRFGPTRQKAIGTKKNPGPLYGFKTDLWAALAVAVTFADAEHLKEGRE